MKNVRIVFSKTGRMKFASHLDMNRLMTRIMRRSGLPIWYTEGFNQHPYITFALPLSLGFTSEYEVMDIRLTDDDFSYSQVKDALSAVMPEGLEVISVNDCIKKASDVAYAEFLICFECSDASFVNSLTEFLSRDSIITEKKTKKGKMKEIDMAPQIKSFSVSLGECVALNIVLTAGGDNNLNPTLLLSTFGDVPYYTVCRKKIYDSDMVCFA